MEVPTMRIKTVTTFYSQDEDRLCLAAVDEGGQQRVLWLTRRLAERLVPALTQGMLAAVTGMEEPACGGGPVPPAAEAAPQEVKDQAAQVYAQLEARLSHKQVAPVQPGPQTPQGLVHEITLKSGEGLRGLEFHCRGMTPCELFFNDRELRQWLHLVRSCFHAAQWREDIWPTWLTPG
jgi:hypothetical protein